MSVSLYYHSPSPGRISISISCNMCLFKTNSLSFLLSENISTLLFYWRILSLYMELWVVSSISIINDVIPLLLIHSFWWKTTIIWNIVWLYIMCHYSLVSFNIFFFSLGFCNLSMMCPSKVYSLYVSFWFYWIYRTLNQCISQNLKSIWTLILKIFLLLHSLLCFWDTNYMYVWPFDII